jgi:hypothetical protein
VFWHRDRRRILADLKEFLRQDSAHRACRGTTPVAAELSFGLPDSELPTAPLALPDGRTVHFRGKADRLDVAADGTLEVVDYKTGRSDRYRGLSSENPDMHGTRLQLVVYALAARLSQGDPDALVRAEYWFTSSKGGFSRRGYDVTDEILRRVGSTVAHMVSSIESGIFPNYPTATSTTPFVECAYCDPDGLGVVDLRRQLERKRGDPLLKPFFALVESGDSGNIQRDLLSLPEDADA